MNDDENEGGCCEVIGGGDRGGLAVVKDKEGWGTQCTDDGEFTSMGFTDFSFIFEISVLGSSAAVLCVGSGFLLSTVSGADVVAASQSFPRGPAWGPPPALLKLI